MSTSSAPPRDRVRPALVRLAAVTLILGGALEVADTPAKKERCTSADGPAVRLVGPQSERFEPHNLPRGTVIDARDAHWDGTEAFAVVIAGARDICFSGGTLRGRWPASTSWDEMHGTGAVLMSGRGALAEDLRVDGYGDSLRFVENSPDFTVRRVHLSDSRDDCIENDWLHSGAVEDSLLDGCYNAFSARGYGQTGARDGSEDVWRIEDSLVRLEPMQRPYKDEGLVPGTAGFFKWDQLGPGLALHGNVFRADQPANTVGLGIPEGKLVDCSDNTMVWLGEGDYPAELPDCFHVTRDVTIWHEAVDRWKQSH